MHHKNKFYRFLRIFLTLFAFILIPVYWHHYGVQNFLWASDIGLFLTVTALWFHSLLLMSIAAHLLVIELAWNIDFWGTFIFKSATFEIADYMFQSHYPFFLRALSTFHIILPFIWLGTLKKYCYDPKSMYYFLVLFWLVVTTTYCCTDPARNINWVFLPQKYAITVISETTWFIAVIILFPLCVTLPTHFIYQKVFKKC